MFITCDRVADHFHGTGLLVGVFRSTAAQDGLDPVDEPGDQENPVIPDEVEVVPLGITRAVNLHLVVEMSLRIKYHRFVMPDNGDRSVTPL